MTKETGGPAFPQKTDLTLGYSGMTLRQYAAIKLKVPNSGTDWLDDMIVASLRDYFAAKAMQALIDNDSLFSEIPTQAYDLADAMLKAREA